jgi:hypothetical protein
MSSLFKPDFLYQKVSYLLLSPTTRTDAFNRSADRRPSATQSPHSLLLFGTSLHCPPSFHSVPLESNTNLPHRNDESAATIIPLEERQNRLANETDDPAVSLWASSEGGEGGVRDLEAGVVRLTERMEVWERKMEARLEERREEVPVSFVISIQE